MLMTLHSLKKFFPSFLLSFIVFLQKRKVWKKIFVLAPASASGGPETLHQVVDSLRRHGRDAHIVYYPGAFGLQCPPQFCKYDCSPVTEIEDSPENLLIVPETNTVPLSQYNRINKCVLWLSKDFYFSNIKNAAAVSLGENASEEEIRQFASVSGLSVFNAHFNSYFHGYNCFYVKQYLKEKHIPFFYTFPLVGPIGKEVLESPVPKTRDNIIAYGYSPNKGTEFIDKVIAQCKVLRPDISYIPIYQKTRTEVVDILSRAKVYVDFGSFPGPERIPREAVWLGCNIITSRSGAAANYYDVPIPPSCKFNAKDEELPHIIQRLFSLCDNYQKNHWMFLFYKFKVGQQHRVFDRSVSRI